MSTTSIHQRIADYETFLDKALENDYSSEDKGYSIDTNDTHVEVAFYSPVTAFKLKTHEISRENFTPENFKDITLKILNSAVANIEDRIDDSIDMGVDAIDAVNNYNAELIDIKDDIRRLKGETARNELITELYPEATVEDIARADMTVHLNTQGEDRAWWVQVEAQTPYGVVVREDHCDFSDLPMEIDAKGLTIEGHRVGIEPPVYIPGDNTESMNHQDIVRILTVSFETMLPELLKDISKVKAPGVSQEELVARVMEQLNPLINIDHKDEISRIVDDAVKAGSTMGRNEKITCLPQLKHLTKDRFVLGEVYDRKDIADITLRAMIGSSNRINPFLINLVTANASLTNHVSMKKLVDHMMESLSATYWEDATEWIEDEVESILDAESDSPLKARILEIETLLLSFQKA